MCLILLKLLLFAIPLDVRVEQRAAIKTSVRAGDDFQTILRRLRAAWGGNALSITQIRHWFKVFQEDPDHTTKDGKHTGRPVSRLRKSKVGDIQTQLHAERRKSVRQLASDVGLSTSTTHRVLKKDLNLKKIAPKFIPKVLTVAQKDFRVKLSQENIAKIEQDPGILARLIGTDETWVYTYDPRTKQADMEWVVDDVPCPRKALRGRSQKKTLLILYFDSHGLITTFFVEETVDSDIYLDSLRQMREDVRHKRPHLWATQNFILLQDNASPHTSVFAAEFFNETNQDLWSHPQYSPDLSPCDYWAFPHLKNQLRGHRYQNTADLKVAIKRTLNNIPVSEYQDCFDKLLMQYRRCVQAGGNYFEGQGKRGLPTDEN